MPLYMVSFKAQKRVGFSTVPYNLLMTANEPNPTAAIIAVRVIAESLPDIILGEFQQVRLVPTVDPRVDKYPVTVTDTPETKLLAATMRRDLNGILYKGYGPTAADDH